MQEILVLYDSKQGATQQLAELIARGIHMVDSMHARIRSVAPVTTSSIVASQTDVPYVEHIDLKQCLGLALGSPVYFGNMSANLKYFFDSTTHEWLTGVLTGKPACVFTSAGSLHGGQESCLLSMMLPLLHHGMLLVGLPYTDSSLMLTESGGTPYGVSHHAGMNGTAQISAIEKKLAIAQGSRLAQITKKIFQ